MASDDATTPPAADEHDEAATSEIAATEPAAPVAPVAPASRRHVDRRSALLGFGALAALVLAFVAGLAVGAHHGGDRHGRGERFAAAGMRGGMKPGGPRGGFDGGGPRGDMPGPGGGGSFGGGGREHGRGGVVGVVTKASSDELTVDPLRGGDDADPVTVTLDDSTDVFTHGADDREDAKASDIDAGAIVAVRADDPGSSTSDDTSITASDVLILRAADA